MATKMFSKESPIEKYLSNMEKLGASDLHLKVFSPPIYRVNGVPRKIEAPPLTIEQLKEMIFAIMPTQLKEPLEEKGSIEFAHGISKVGRFRISVFQQRGSLSLSARHVRTKIPDLKELNLPESLSQFSSYDSGMVLVVGASGSGKSTTLASLLQRINATRRCHILTIEDPIEFMYTDAKSFINQREVGMDVPDFYTALRYGLRQDPDVILVGEMRDADTIETALSAAETGHLVFATLHSRNAKQTISRMLDFFPGDRQHPLRQTIAFTLRAVLAQKLLPGCTKEVPRVPVAEVMFVNAVIKKIIADDEDERIPETLRNMARDGLQDFNMGLYKLVHKGLITYEVALDNSPNPQQLKMQLGGVISNEDQGTMT
ncbi:MAG: PilT/PilU family type 4a pilus ATPase [Planctomycetes bacterium]|nr:PilT/PilU family type 4a pilus ATPase [Planctomycetota bacterium]